MTQIGWTFNPEHPTYRVREKPAKAIIDGRMVQAYLWSRTILCPSCTGLIPLSPNWRLSKGLGIRLLPNHDFNVVEFEVVRMSQTSYGTVGKGIAVCPLCGSTCPKGYPAAESQAERMGHIQYCVIYRNRYPVYRASGKPIQGRDPLQFEVPGSVLYESDTERWRCIKSKGLRGIAESDPLLRELGLFGGTESDYAPGVVSLGVL